MTNEDTILNVPTNIITGFLGTGKTTAILNLLKNKPEDEKWAVLVNEFGEIGIDGSIFEGAHGGDGVFIREVPGGCMCCTAGLSMQIALNILLTKSRPDRLLIEPTGLGHPVEVLEILLGEHYQDVLSIQKTVTLVDARNLSDSRYTSNDIFNQQISIADLIVGNKADLYNDEDRDLLTSYAEEKGASYAELAIIEQAILDPEWLNGSTQATVVSSHSDHKHGHSHKHTKLKTPISEMAIPESGYIKAENKRGGFQSSGWRFTPLRIFERNKLVSFFTEIEVERLKGVFITHDGIFGYNKTADGLSEVELGECMESRVEIIAPEIEMTWEEQLMECITAN